MKRRVLSLIIASVMILGTMSFTVFAEEQTYVAKIGDVGYTDFSTAMATANDISGTVEVEIYGAVEFTDGMELNNGNYDSITFVGKDTDAQITINQTAGGDYLTAHEKTVSFISLILAKANPAHATNSGHMGYYFSVQGGVQKYTNCKFPNGACANTATSTYTECEFYNTNTTSKYSLWVYDDADVTVNKCKFTGLRGIKMYEEGETELGNSVTVKETDFSKTTNSKPAIVLTYGESVTLEGNTYNEETGVFELDNEGTPNGTTVTADITDIACKNDNYTDCGVLVDGKIYVTLADAAEDITESSTVTLMYNSTETVELPEGVTLNKNGYSAENVTVAQPENPAPAGSINGGLVNVQDKNRTFLTIESYITYTNESVVVKVYDANGTLLATSSLVDKDRVLLGNKNFSLSTFVGINCTDSWWNTIWEAGKLRADYVPAKATLFVDGNEMNTATIQMRATGTETEVIWAEVPGVAPAKLPEAKLEKLAPRVLTAEVDNYMTWPSGDSSIDRPLNVVVKFSSVDTEETVAASAYKDWYTDFYITFEGISGGSFDPTGCYLAGNYGSFGWVVIPVEELGLTNVANGEVYPVVSAFDPHLTYEEICTNVKEMICAIYIKDEIIEANPDMVVTLNLGIKDGDDREVKYVNSSVYDTDTLAGYVAKIGEKKYTSLQEALNDSVKAGKNVTVDILADIDLSDVDWSPVSVDGSSNPAAHLVTVNGNKHKITHLNNMLFSGTWAGKSGLIINDLTIADSNIVNDKDDTEGTVGVGAFIGYPQASEIITLNNCHLIDSRVEGGHWTGGLIGMAGGYNGDDGPVFMNLTITGCSVKDSVITGKGSAGGLMGHASCAAWTKVVVENTVVSGNTVASTGSSNEKAGAVFGTVGAAGQETTADGETKIGGQFVAATVKNNTVTSNGTTITTIYGRQGTPTGKLELTGGSYDHKPISGEESWAGIKAGLALEENADGTYSVEREYTITLSADGGMYADGTSAVAFNAFFKQWESQTVDAFGMYIYKQIDNLGTKATVDRATAGTELVAAEGLFNAVVTDIPAEYNDAFIVCVPYVIVDGNITAGDAKAVTARQFTKVLAD